MDQPTFIAVVSKLEEIIGHAHRNAEADPSQYAKDTWRAHARSCQYVLDKIIAQTKN